MADATAPLATARIWPESNCYVDLWVGALQWLGVHAEPMLACALTAQFDVDQWTFCKPTASELADLYGIRVEELNIWRDLREQVFGQVRAGRLVLVEVDAFYLPDTAGVSYGIGHQKTTIGLRHVSDDGERITYFHNTGCFELDGDDLRGALSTRVGAHELPPFAELADVALLRRESAARLVPIAKHIASRRYAVSSTANPFAAWSLAAASQLADLAQRDIGNFHAWAFATVRQAGAMAELTAQWCEWMRTHDADATAASLNEAELALRDIAQTLAAQQFRLARVPAGRPHPGFAAALSRCAELWTASDRIVRAYTGAAFPSRG